MSAKPAAIGYTPPVPPHVLIVEDDHDVREMLEMFLSHSGFSISSATNGAEALDRMRERQPCVVLLDLMMPVMTGWQFRERQMADAKLAKVPVVCVTAAADPNSISAQLGVQCMSKPVDLEVLINVVHRVCSGPRES